MDKYRHELFGPPISIYTKADAVDDGTQVIVGRHNTQLIYLTSTLLDDGYDNTDIQRELIKQGMIALRNPDIEDTPTMKLRTLRSNTVWVIQAPDGITFMKPEDY